MAEEDEIDILGDFNLDTFLSKSDSGIYESTPLVSQNSDILNCDYTIHPQWLLDKPSTNPDCWYDNKSELESELAEKSSCDIIANNDADGLVHISTQNSITDESGWTDNEKHLLERGIEIFGKSHVRLAQFIGSRTPAEVKYYFKNFYNEPPSSYSTFNGGIVEELNIVNNLVSDVLDETQIPASIEEVIAAVSTAKPTVPPKVPRKKTVSINEDVATFKDIPSGHSVLKPSILSDGRSRSKSKSKKSVKFKIKTQLKFPMSNVIKQKTVKICNKVGKVEITTGKGLSVPICEGEQVVKICKDDSDTDVEIDVEDPDDIKPKQQQEVVKQQENEDKLKVEAKPSISSPTGNAEESQNSQIKQKSYLDIESLDEPIVKELMSLEEPKNEIDINHNFISELEKVIHSEFFEGRPTKTPLRYLKIRNHIIDCWLSSKPSYVTKTSIRQGLKNCGDVNCISRVHCYLEQIGAINFGCSQTTYTRPLYDVFQATAPTPREKPTKDQTNPRPNLDHGPRHRTKRKIANVDGDGGCTLTHDEKGQVINTMIVKEEAPKPKMYFKKPTIRLIYCRPFSDDQPQKYKIKLNLSTLLLMDFHAHTSLTEVMGLVAGTWNPQTKILQVSHYEPCRNIASSSTHCDMCPISQMKASELIQNKGLSVLGWFHSHPTFAPEPSQQDLDTQQDVQRWIGARTPCIGVILSPFSSHGALIASPFRCMIVDKKQHFEDQFVPYKFRVDIVANADDDIEGFFEDIQKIYRNSLNMKGSKVDFNQSYFQDTSISYLEKYITSVRMHLAKCGTLSKSMCDYIIDTINSICSPNE